jgi:hypothetical protein
MNTSIKTRLERLENEQRFQEWLEVERFLESFNEKQLEDLAANWHFPDPLPDPLPPGKSRLDHLDRKTLIRMWQENESEFAGRTAEEYNFYTMHGHWPEQACIESKCRKISQGGTDVWRTNLPDRNTQGT